jgi:hypothetical protein
MRANGWTRCRSNGPLGGLGSEPLIDTNSPGLLFLDQEVPRLDNDNQEEICHVDLNSWF